MQRKLFNRVFTVGNLRQPITSGVATFKRGLERALLLCGRLKFEVDYQFHIFKYRRKYETVNYVKTPMRPFPPRPKRTGYLGAI